MFIRKGTCQVTCGVDGTGQWLALSAAGEAPELIRLPKWLGGIGGMELVVSADERFYGKNVDDHVLALGSRVVANRKKKSRTPVEPPTPSS